MISVIVSPNLYIFSLGISIIITKREKKKRELITKEEYEKLNNKPKMFDYYTFDLYPEKKRK